MLYRWLKSQQGVFWIYGFSFLICLFPEVTSPMALILGMVLSLGIRLELPSEFKTFGKILLQLSIVGWGFSLNPHVVWKAGTYGIGFTLVGLIFTFFLGYGISWLFKVPGVTATLMTVGTAICGGSAIAAIGPVIGAKNEEMSVSLAVVFLLNAVALFLFPFLGQHLQMSSFDFGYWSALAIHDTSSVVAAATHFHSDSLPVAITVKLTRALWIVPVTLVAGYYYSRKKQIQQRFKILPPWFITAFVAAVFLKALFPETAFGGSLKSVYEWFAFFGKTGLKGAIFIIGAQMSWKLLKQVGFRPLLFAVTLWLIVSCASFFAIKWNLFVPAKVALDLESS